MSPKTLGSDFSLKSNRNDDVRRISTAHSIIF